jgi:hypothetical protein
MPLLGHSLGDDLITVKKEFAMLHADGASVFNLESWEGSLKGELRSFLGALQTAVVTSEPASMLISYTPDAGGSPLAAQARNSSTFAAELCDYFRTIGLEVEALPLSPTLGQDLQDRRFAIVLCILPCVRT